MITFKKVTHWLLGPAIIATLLALLWIFTSWEMSVIVIGLVLIIIFHEFGHFIAAKGTGMMVTDFFLGMGPKLWAVKHKETTYGIRALPVGGYVRIPGYYMNERDIDPKIEHRSYRHQPFRSRLMVVSAGPATHFIITVLLFFILYAFVGYAGISSSFDDNTASTTTTWEISSITENSAAEQAGLLPGDKIIAVDGQEVKNYRELKEDYIVTKQPGESVNFTVLRDDKIISVSSVTLGLNPNQPSSSVGFLGISPEFEYPAVNPLFASGYAFRDTGLLISESVQSLGRIFTPGTLTGFVSDTFNPDSGDSSVLVLDDATGNTVLVDQSQDDEFENRITSLVGIAQAGEDAVGLGIEAVLLLFIILNVFLGLLNLLPVLPFDGGHVAIAVYEKIRSRNGERHYADITRMAQLAIPIIAFFILLGSVAIYRDIVDPIDLG